jgi:polysaccharide biosynthesis protein PslG
MFRRPSRGLLLSKAGLLTIGVIALTACGAGVPAESGPTLATVPHTASPLGAPVTAGPLAIASMPATTKPKPTKPKAAATTHRPVSTASSSGVVFGIADGSIPSLSASGQAQELDAIKAMGMTSVRVDASWYNTENGGPGDYNWAPLDTTVAAIRSAGLTADLIIDQCPPWAAASGASGQFAQPASASTFAGFAAAVVKRYYGKGASYFEIWNEPNISEFWSPGPNPAAYTADLKAAYTAIKAVAPSAMVITAGLAPAANNGNTMDTLTFVQDMYADGAAGYFDALGDHPYTYPNTPDSVILGSAWSEMDQTSPSLRSLMIAHGDGAKKIWITEYGAPTSGTTNNVSADEQSTEIVDTIAQAKQLGWIGSLYIYSWEDSGSGDGFGILNSDGSQKPAYSAISGALSG